MTPPRRQIKHETTQQAIQRFYRRQGHMPAWAEEVSKRNLDKFSTLVERIQHDVKALKLFKYNQHKHGPLRGVPVPPGWDKVPFVATGDEIVHDGVWFVLDPSTFGADGTVGVPKVDAESDDEDQQEPQELESGVYVVQLEFVLYKLTPLAKGAQLNIVDPTRQSNAFLGAVGLFSDKAPRGSRKRRREKNSGDGSSSSSGDNSSSDDSRQHTPQRTPDDVPAIMAAINDMIDQKIGAPLAAISATLQQLSTNLLAVFSQLLQQPQPAPQQADAGLQLLPSLIQEEQQHGIMEQLLAFLAQQEQQR